VDEPVIRPSIGSKKNRFGLSRDIPAQIKREVRKRCGFGCVVCGSGIIQYEHVDPEYKDAPQHDADCIALLCPSCHGKVTTKYWSKQKIKAAMINPACLKSGFTKDFFDFCDGHPTIMLGGTILKNTRIPLRILDKPILKIAAPEQPGAPFRLSGSFCDSMGRLTLQIVDNEWIASSSLWDVEVGGGKILIRNGPRNVVLVILVSPPNMLIIKKLEMNFGPVAIRVGCEDFFININEEGNQNLRYCLVDGPAIGVDILSMQRDSSHEPVTIIARQVRHYAINGWK
jgi:hypothetical protein